MNKSITNHISNYLSFCRANKRLDPKTIKAYKIDLTHFAASMTIAVVEDITSEILNKYIANLHQKYKPKTVKRKIASLKAFVSFLDETELIVFPSSLAIGMYNSFQDGYPASIVPPAPRKSAVFESRTLCENCSKKSLLLKNINYTRPNTNR